MKQTRWAALGLGLLLVPLLIGCDSGTVPTAIPADAVNGASLTATALAPAANDAANGISLTATALAPTVSSAATAVTTAASGAATAATTALSGSMSAADQAYLTQVNDLATKMQNSAELSSAVQALSAAAATGATGGTVDATALNDKLQKANTFLTGIAQQASALQPPADLKSVQDELMAPITDWQKALTTAQTAVGASNWNDAATAAAQMTQAVTGLGTLITDLAARGVR